MIKIHKCSKTLIKFYFKNQLIWFKGIIKLLPIKAMYIHNLEYAVIKKLLQFLNSILSIYSKNKII